MKFKRVLLKISGEALMGEGSYGISPEVIRFLSQEIQALYNLKIELGLVVGAGNIFRGVAGAASGMDRSSADNMGMLGTVMNSLAVQDGLESLGIPAKVMSAITMLNVCEPYERLKAIEHLERKRIVIFAAGTGNPYFTTDTAAVLRALEIKADVIMKATRVDGVYDRDPEKDPGAIRYHTLTFSTVLRDDLRIMDAAGISLARDNDLPIFVFNMTEPGNIVRAVIGEDVGTLITN
ncbi:UMP kinase [Desulfobulbus oligotrophicus]|jgi:uridylate kinase|uniref:Uridylate kinase n=1 Tax=Desulfobulbus oligotrophicus TaxID=1909699 RepID=A0A7T5VD75_9BACT|nr:UMP kinase [Desulfobulbus oligotrophicus]MDY0390394.1 UMP kinase [Desulfobulbus oligotrophicus]QQG65755.1 UMP kinase [Desulfobulbus oligotrophicus]